MATPTVRKGKTILSSGDACPRGCNSGNGTATHLMSDHVEEKARQCTKCSCVAQDTHK